MDVLKNEANNNFFAGSFKGNVVFFLTDVLVLQKKALKKASLEKKKLSHYAARADKNILLFAFFARQYF